MEMLTLIISLYIIQLLICTLKLYQVRAGWFGVQEQVQPPRRRNLLMFTLYACLQPLQSQGILIYML